MPLDRAAMARLRRKHQAGMLSVARDLTGKAKERATRHVNIGTLRNSVTETVQASASRTQVLWGISLRSAPHAKYLERGFRPHWVPMRHLHLWAKRSGAGQVRSTSGFGSKSKSYKSSRAVALGLFIGGRGSRLDYAPGGAQAYRNYGKRRVLEGYRTKGKPSRYLDPGKVGFSILQHTVGTHIRSIGVDSYKRGFDRG